MDPTRDPAAMPLFRRVALTNAAILTLAVAGLALTPATVGFPVEVSEVVILTAGLFAVVAVNVLILRPAFRPLEELAREMEAVDADAPRRHTPITGPAEVEALVRAFDDMLARLDEERRRASGRVLRGQEEERRRIARELHDEIGQGLTALLLQIDHVRRRAPEDLQDALSDAREMARAALDEVRGVARRLRPDVLDDLGLVSALASLADRARAQKGLRVVMRFDGLPDDLGAERELVVYRVTQEALTNVVRHALAHRVEVVVAGDAEGVLLTIRDDGRGITDPRGAAAGDGIRGMRERARMVGGELHVSAPPGGGTEIRLSLPCPAHAP